MNEMEILQKRIERLEKVVFAAGKSRPRQNPDDDFSGVTGGLRFLLSRKFFDSKRSLGDIKTELEKHNRHSSLQAVQTALNRLSKSSGPLITFKEGGKKLYAERK